MIVRCAACKHLELRSAPEMAAHGFGRCQVKPRSEYRSVTMGRECAEFVAGPRAVDAAAHNAIAEMLRVVRR